MNIAISTVYRIYAPFEQTGGVEPLPPTARCDSRKLDEHSKLYIIGLVMDNPSTYLAEVDNDEECIKSLGPAGWEGLALQCLLQTI